VDSPARIFIVDDHPVVRKGLRDILSGYATLEVVGEAADAAEALELAERAEPDIILLDIMLPDAIGIRLIRQLKERARGKVIVLTTFDDDEYLFGAFREGADGFLLKTASAEELKDAIARVGKGDRLVAPKLSSKVLDRLEDTEKRRRAEEAGLTEEDVKILRLIAEGATSSEIATAVFVSEITVKRRVSEILEKLGARHRAQAVFEAMQRGLL
jgi:two-component system, NarL family, response regulator DevR